jgi:hypothetical protein
MKSKLLITIDTEVRIRNRELPDAFDVDVLGRAGESACGAYWVAELLSRHGLTGIFFLDVYGSERFGESRYRELCDRLLEGGHSIQLHTHPDQVYDPKRRHMHEYSFEEQTSIIGEGIALMKEWTGDTPIAHRAGRYGANEDTLRALHAKGIDLDSSFFYGRADCKLPFENTNAPFKANGVWEIPVTVVPEPVEKLGFRFPAWTRQFWRNFGKLDVNCMTAPQLCNSVMEVCGHVPYIVTFLHSFSFIRREPAGVVPDEAAIASFQALLGLVKEEQIPVVTFEDIAAELGERESSAPRVEV